MALIPAPGLADLVEAGKQNGPEGEALLRPLLEPYVGKLDALVLGCTHYPFAIPMLRKLLGETIDCPDGGEGTALHTRTELERKGLLHDGPGCLTIENSLPDPRILELSHKLVNME